MDIVVADRLQFAFTIMFHYLFPIITMGLVPFVALYSYKAYRDGTDESARAAAFWTKIFAINFAIGVVTGIPMEFRFGTNWAEFSARSGSVIGQPLAMEGIYAFFLESIFYGNFNANVKGLNAYATELWPPVELTYYAYHVMLGLGTIFVVTMVGTVAVIIYSIAVVRALAGKVRASE